MATSGTSRRRTGRTTRMLADAHRLAAEGKAVYVVFSRLAEAKAAEHRIDPRTGIKCETLGSLHTLDPFTLRLVGARPNCVVLIDHYAIEEHFGPLLEMLHRYDEVRS